MVESVGDDGILIAQKGFENTAVSVEASSVKDRIFSAKEFGNLLFQFFVKVGAAADETHGGHAVAVGVEGLLGGGNQLRVVGQPKVIVGAEVECLLTILEGNLTALGRDDDAFVLVQTCFFDVV